MINTKICSKCQLRLPHDAFYTKKSRLGQKVPASHCKTCHKWIVLKWQKNNTERLKWYKKKFNAKSAKMAKVKKRTKERYKTRLTGISFCPDALFKAVKQRDKEVYGWDY
jgi:Pyruvate/2-oxoacid:ferredoxin oxidoreductase delta subunit